MILFGFLMFPNPTIASCCFNYDCDPIDYDSKDTCPSSGYACLWTEEKHECDRTGCNHQTNCMVTYSGCYIYEGCAPIYAGGPCSLPWDPTFITSKWSYAIDIGTDAGCELKYCFFCSGENPPPRCGFETRNCPQ